jgi:hypothetical protein
MYPQQMVGCPHNGKGLRDHAEGSTHQQRRCCPVESIAKWPVAAIPFLLLEARAYLEGVGNPDMKCQSIAAGATPRHCLARGPLTDRTKTVPNAGQNTVISDY